ncbi:hypothetical protein DFP72DRAFT_1151810 [Ephemerocybe angulata]|uniref:Uncharacterized protein n=1 Tax=Ephemerocybe angulata TaxID=980116 RepID=A0A8H6ICK5_9AGAR|nr:hypothetical protein DFP72DRAFT_1151810 [Tulosesus angulatus]
MPQPLPQPEAVVAVPCQEVDCSCRCWCDHDYEMIEPPTTVTTYELPKVNKVQTKPKFPPKTPRFPKAGKRAVEERAMEEMDLLILVLQATANKRAPGPIFHAHLKTLGLRTLHWVFSTALNETLQSLMGRCHTCTEFVNKYGNLCTIDDEGEAIPVLWPQDLETVPVRYRPGVAAVLKTFSGCGIGEEYAVAQPKDRILGYRKGKNPQWRHLHTVLNGGPLTAGSKDGLDTLTSPLPMPNISSMRSFLMLGPHRSAIDFLEAVQSKTGPVEDARRKRNLIIKFSRLAWVGCLSSLRGGVVGELMSDISAGKSYDDIHIRWSSLANPLVYLRPTSAPSAGNISEAEKIFNNLGYSKEDLVRYFMTSDQVPESGVLWSDPAIWNHTPPALELPQGIFGSVVPKATKEITPVSIEERKETPREITFRSFARRILPKAKSVEVFLQEDTRFAFFTSGGPNAKSPFSFGSTTNTASWYYWNKPMSVSKANVKKGWNPVSSIIAFPHMWEHVPAAEGIDYDEAAQGDTIQQGKWPFSRHGIRYLLCVKGAKEEQKMAASLFPTIMRGEFHCVRKTVEAFSNEEKIKEPLKAGAGVEHIGGLAGGNHRWTEILVRATMEDDLQSVYRITLYE